jgi:hypothetical protein
MAGGSLVAPLFEGPIDVVGDVHGEIDALRDLLRHLGYSDSGAHSGRRLVFVGDLTDRGPDSPAVVALVSELVYAGRAQCVLGNHDFNLLLGRKKVGNHWFFGEPEAPDADSRDAPQARADERARAAVVGFFARLPLALERPDCRVVHACWNPAMIELARNEASAVSLFAEFKTRIKEGLRQLGIRDDIEREMEQQNRNPVKVLTSGRERPAASSFEAGGRVRRLERADWWAGYRDEPLCVFGHYGRVLLPGESAPGELFDDANRYAALAGGCAVCVDYSVGKRWRERLAHGGNGPFRARLGALRWPEGTLVFDNGESVPLRR